MSSDSTAEQSILSANGLFRHMMSCLSMQNNKKKEYTLEQSDTSISLLSFYAHCKPYKKNKADH